MRRNRAPWMKPLGNDPLYFDSPRDRRLAISRRAVVYLVSVSTLVGTILIAASLIR